MKGPEAVIPTSEISVVYLRKNGTIALPIVIGVVSALGAMFGAAFTTEGLSSDGAVISIMLASAAGGATAGALLGREAGKKTVPINVGPRP
jgi:hypothetical protein